MCKRIIIIIFIVAFFIFSFAMPALSSNMRHDTTYFLEGDIDIKKQSGHFCNTGAEMKQVVSGEGSLRKFSNIYMQNNFLQVLDNNDWFTDIDAEQNLNVTTTIQLCAPGKFLYREDGTTVPEELLYPMLDTDVVGVFRVIEPISAQLWATSVTAAPGHSGSLHTGFDAAYGPYAGALYDFRTGTSYYRPAGPDEWQFQTPEGEETYAAWGSAYAGNYFSVQQYAKTTYGITRRLIDIRSPFSHAYVSERSLVVGGAEVSEAFSMRNLVPETGAAADWWSNF